MKVVGDGHIKFYGPEDEVPHAFGSSQWWNESVWLHFLDVDSGVNGIMRIGHQPNWQGGSTAVWAMVQTPKWIYKRDGLSPMRAGDRTATGFKSGGTHSFDFDGRCCRWVVNDGEFSADLKIEDYHAPLSFWPKGSEMEKLAPNHTEASGKVSGTIVIKGQEFKLTNALGYRDHSWGERLWDTLRSHRWLATTFGPDLACNTIVWLNEEYKIGRYGYVRRGDSIYTATDVEVLTYMDLDGLSHHGGVIRLTIDGGERVQIDCKPVNKAMITRHHNLAMNDTMCWAKTGDRVGATCFEVNSNPQAGKLMPQQQGLVLGIVDNGIWPA